MQFGAGPLTLCVQSYYAQEPYKGTRYFTV